MSLKILRVLYVLFCISSICSMSGLDAFQTLITFVVLILFFQQWRTQKKSIFQFHSLNGIGTTFLVFCLIVLMGWFFNSAPGVSYFEGVRKLKWIYNWYLTTALYFLFPMNKKALKWISGTLGVLGIYGLAVFFAKYDLIRGPSWYMHPTSEAPGASVRYGGFFGHPMTFSHVILPLVMWISGLFFVALSAKFFDRSDSKTRSFKVFSPKAFFQQNPILSWLVLAVAGGSLSLLLTFTRGVWIASAVGVLVMLFFLHRRWMLMAMVAGAVSLVAISAVSPQFKDRLLSAVDSQHKHHDERKLVWKTNFEMFKDYPWLGIGFKDNTRRLDEYYDRLQIPQTTIKSHAHNQFLQVLATTGILGFLIYMMIWGKLIHLAYRNWIDLQNPSLKLPSFDPEGIFPDSRSWMQGLSLGALGAFVAFLVAGMSECNFDDAKVNYMLAFVVASVMWVKFQIQKGSLEKI